MQVESLNDLWQLIYNTSFVHRTELANLTILLDRIMQEADDRIIITSQQQSVLVYAEKALELTRLLQTELWHLSRSRRVGPKPVNALPDDPPSNV
jgi:hypothetical protein